jgi:hypothetical protein
MNMTKRIGPLLIIAPQDSEQCQFCLKMAECRPYGPDDKNICFACSEKPEYRDIVARKFKELLMGEKIQ